MSVFEFYNGDEARVFVCFSPERGLFRVWRQIHLPSGAVVFFVFSLPFLVVL